METGEQDGVKMLFTVNWLSDCVYTLQIKKILRDDHSMGFDPDMIITVTITDVHKKWLFTNINSKQFRCCF